jgi:carbamoyl-phosphate synthase large subunit
LFKGLRSLEAVKPLRLVDVPHEELQRKLARPNSQRFSYITYALQNGYSIDEVHRLTKIDPWFLDQLSQVMEFQDTLDAKALSDYTDDEVRIAKEYGLSDRRLSFLTGASELRVREHRKALGIAPVYKRVDTCGAEFESFTPYMYSTVRRGIGSRSDESSKDHDPRLGSESYRAGNRVRLLLLSRVVRAS